MKTSTSECLDAGEPTKFAGGYSAAAVLGNSLLVVGGIDDEKEIIDSVECCEEGIGWTSSGFEGHRKDVFLLGYCAINAVMNQTCTSVVCFGVMMLVAAKLYIICMHQSFSAQVYVRMHGACDLGLWSGYGRVI